MVCSSGRVRDHTAIVVEWIEGQIRMTEEEGLEGV